MGLVRRQKRGGVQRVAPSLMGGRTWTRSEWEEVVGVTSMRVTVVKDPAAAKAKRDRKALLDALKGLLRYAERNECHHGETKRGGAIWTICQDCGQKWADDEGGFQPYVEPAEIAGARAAIAKAEGK